MVYVEQVGIKRQEGGKSGEIRYLYPRTNPIETALAIVLILVLISISARRSRSSRTGSSCHQGYQGSPDFIWVDTGELRTNSKDDIGLGRIMISSQTEGLPNDPLEAVSFDRPMNFPMHTDTQPAATGRIGVTDQGETFPMQTLALAINFFKLPGLANQGAFQKSVSGQSYADSLRRPFARRDRITARPALVLILSRNPWVRLRFRLLG